MAESTKIINLISHFLLYLTALPRIKWLQVHVDHSLRHGGGWESVYSHYLKGGLDSVDVALPLPFKNNPQDLPQSQHK